MQKPLAKRIESVATNPPCGGHVFVEGDTATTTGSVRCRGCVFDDAVLSIVEGGFLVRLGLMLVATESGGRSFLG